MLQGPDSIPHYLIKFFVPLKTLLTILRSAQINANSSGLNLGAYSKERSTSRLEDIDRKDLLDKVSNHK